MLILNHSSVLADIELLLKQFLAKKKYFLNLWSLFHSIKR
jgi:hypothetical protein